MLTLSPGEKLVCVLLLTARAYLYSQLVPFTAGAVRGVGPADPRRDSRISESVVTRLTTDYPLVLSRGSVTHGGFRLFWSPPVVAGHR